MNEAKGTAGSGSLRQIAAELDRLGFRNERSAVFDNQGRLCIGPGGIVIIGNALGTTGAVTGTLAAAQGKTTYICGFKVDAIGGTAAVGPITVAGPVGSSMVFQGSSSAAGGPVARQNFSPCIQPVPERGYHRQHHD